MKILSLLVLSVFILSCSKGKVECPDGSLAQNVSQCAVSEDIEGLSTEDEGNTALDNLYRNGFCLLSTDKTSVGVNETVQVTIYGNDVPPIPFLPASGDFYHGYKDIVYTQESGPRSFIRLRDTGELISAAHFPISFPIRYRASGIYTPSINFTDSRGERFSCESSRAIEVGQSQAFRIVSSPSTSVPFGQSILLSVADVNFDTSSEYVVDYVTTSPKILIESGPIKNTVRVSSLINHQATAIIDVTVRTHLMQRTQSITLSFTPSNPQGSLVCSLSPTQSSVGNLSQFNLNIRILSGGVGPYTLEDISAVGYPRDLVLLWDTFYSPSPGTANIRAYMMLSGSYTLRAKVYDTATGLRTTCETPIEITYNLPACVLTAHKTLSDELVGTLPVNELSNLKVRSNISTANLELRPGSGGSVTGGNYYYNVSMPQIKQIKFSTQGYKTVTAVVRRFGTSTFVECSTSFSVLSY